MIQKLPIQPLGLNDLSSPVISVHLIFGGMCGRSDPAVQDGTVLTL